MKVYFEQTQKQKTKFEGYSIILMNFIFLTFIKYHIGPSNFWRQSHESWLGLAARDEHFEILGFGLWIFKNLGSGLDSLDLSRKIQIQKFQAWIQTPNLDFGFFLKTLYILSYHVRLYSFQIILGNIIYGYWLYCTFIRPKSTYFEWNVEILYKTKWSFENKFDQNFSNLITKLKNC